MPGRETTPEQDRLLENVSSALGAEWQATLGALKAVKSAREAGVSWERIGDRMGFTRQGARRFWTTKEAAVRSAAESVLGPL